MLLLRIAPLLILSMIVAACKSPQMAEVNPRSQETLGTESDATNPFYDPNSGELARPSGPSSSGGDGGLDIPGGDTSPTGPSTTGWEVEGPIDDQDDLRDTELVSSTELPLDGGNEFVGDTAFEIVYFAYDQSTIGDTERVKLDRVAEHLMKNPTYNLLIEGHCDERGSEEYNRSLGERRAIAARDYLTARGIASLRLTTQSYGEERPAVQGTGDESYSKNRRAELKLVTPQATP